MFKVGVTFQEAGHLGFHFILWHSAWDREHTPEYSCLK